ncbi:uncharacterized protein Z519_06584 [Cladophialophora bantiana CBS 173.52]|uniref:Zn(2)-C6 fungal-type domain-containing protein n=1 Tax=Cladophialophora bantiana (strain ATCC 10958 / CBS 173.52 / CDC B-1940 / NIH 8579) TaxID=1442370 RepID=A0A0D2ES48_CLAB1|nr:uncharacterized protein Z519_06584 [Cladophialophora bantiana CBS 173.52]KIW92736.1 hypothetical protein Z519_06584 [Cladophialophora bantiana CBS 173.52]
MTTPPIKKACDACHRRKVRCSGGQPCRTCGQSNLECTYLAVPQKKGPKGNRSKILSEIRTAQRKTKTQANLPRALPSAASSPQLTGHELKLSLDFKAALLSKQTIENCVAFYFSNMSTTTSILNRHHLMDTIPSQIATCAESYCLAGSLCAFVMVQPGMNLAVAPGSHYEGEPPETRYGYANMLLDDVIRARKSIDYVEFPTLSAVQTSFFLFSCYFTLEKQNICWFHLREAATLAQLMGMHEESSYQVGDPVENMYKRRMYWLLLVTERAYALERHRPLSLHPTIGLPSPNDSEEQEAISGFLYLISLFRCIDDEFMALWNKVKSECSATWLLQLQRQLTDALPPRLRTTESQMADVWITFHWLRIMIWQLSIPNGVLSSSSNESSMTFKYPIEVARDLIEHISDISLDAMEVHGVGLIEKLFDIACTLTDVISCVPLEPSEISNPSNETAFEYLSKLLTLISQLRGGASRYFPLLLVKVSETLPNSLPHRLAPTHPDPDPPMPILSIKQGYAGASDHIPTPEPTQYSSIGSFSFSPKRIELGGGLYYSPQQQEGREHKQQNSEHTMCENAYTPDIAAGRDMSSDDLTARPSLDTPPTSQSLLGRQTHSSTQGLDRSAPMGGDDRPSSGVNLDDAVTRVESSPKRPSCAFHRSTSSGRVALGPHKAQAPPPPPPHGGSPTIGSGWSQRNYRRPWEEGSR